MSIGYLPNGDIIDHEDLEDDDDVADDEDEEGDEVPALPSVKLLTDKFQSISVETKKRQAVKKVTTHINMQT